MRNLERVGPDRHDPEALPVVVLAHNEANILPDFLDHYRRICRPSFLIVDDRSSDGTAEFLADQPDVTVFRPLPHSHFKTDKAEWRGEIMDALCAGRWSLVPDLDEHFVPPVALDTLIPQIEAEGAEVVLTIMIDMYDDRPLADHVYPDPRGLSLAESFPFFDTQDDFPQGYIMRPVTPKVLALNPSPPKIFNGGARHRIFYPKPKGAGPVAQWVVRHRFGLDRPINARASWLDRRVSRKLFSGSLNCTKLGLLKWKTGMRFAGGPHKADTALRCSEAIAAFLHYPLTRGRKGVEYIAQRGQHADDSEHYKRLLEGGALERSPVFAGSKRYSGPGDLAGLIRGVPGR
ncbi:glycosyltransferase family 2 protein [Salipiger abyssi]|uniref:Glycosyl transferase family 2 n=1 Tax=Salipiger abyssi TaxID=1250539 RepID=A0A1P8UVS1_9RHOB|nr:glycosyltransferase family 2 protein [Salipiger abyssi]APZ53473.1 Glycosyl transferase family 2 [Salipiger abyssi]